MKASTRAASVPELLAWREQFRGEAAGQIVHDSLHLRQGWTQSYVVVLDGTDVGYGSLAVGGPWAGTRTLFEFHVAAPNRGQAVELFASFLEAGAATHFEIQTSHPLLYELVRARAGRLTIEKIVFRDERTTAVPAPAEARFRRAVPGDDARMFPHHDEPVGDWLIEVDDAIAATGGVLSHYNPPYRDLFLEVAAPFRRRRLGTHLLQELKRVCRDEGGIPCARCDPDNLPSRRTIERAGFVAWADIVSGPFSPAQRFSP